MLSSVGTRAEIPDYGRTSSHGNCCSEYSDHYFGFRTHSVLQRSAGDRYYAIFHVGLSYLP